MPPTRVLIQSIDRPTGTLTQPNPPTDHSLAARPPSPSPGGRGDDGGRTAAPATGGGGGFRQAHHVDVWAVPHHHGQVSA